MYPHGVIYQKGKSSRHGFVNLHAPLKTKILYSLLRGLGAGIIGFVIIAFLFTFGPLIKEEVNYDLNSNHTNYQASETELINAQNTSQVQEEAKNLGLNSYFSVYIPKIDAKANIIANVDPSNSEEYDRALNLGIAHAKGTYFPGQNKNIFLFAHSTNAPWLVARYNAVFYLLDKLEVGDEIIVYFADQKFVYKVYKTQIVSPQDTSALTSQTDTENLILQTCYPPGTSWNRLLVLAKPI